MCMLGLERWGGRVQGGSRPSHHVLEGGLCKHKLEAEMGIVRLSPTCAEFAFLLLEAPTPAPPLRFISK